MYYRLGSVRSSNSAAPNFNAAARLLVGAFLNRHVRDENVWYDLFDPSIADYVMAEHFDDVELIEELLDGLRTPQAVANLQSICTAGHLSKSALVSVLGGQISRVKADVNSEQLLTPYILKILLWMLRSGEVVGFREFIEECVSDALRFGSRDLGNEYLEFIELSMKGGLCDCADPKLRAEISRFILEDEPGYDGFVILSRIISYLEPVPGSLTEAFKGAVVEHLKEEFTRMVDEEGVLMHVYDECMVDPATLRKYLDSLVDELSIGLDVVAVDSIASCCDLEEIINNNVDRSSDDDHNFEVVREERIDSAAVADAIEDLFMRD
ncbi:MAG: hypothetical protein IT582_10150 [Opitutaceae bacterium]|nr:hypothetical protein [Opitutaceae bacterium]